MSLVAHLIALVIGHGAMLLPPPRNAIDSTIPGNNWGNGTNSTGKIEILHCSCTNGTEACRPGQSVFWFSQGCTPGCDSCDHNGQRVPFWDHCNATRKTPFKPTLDPIYRSANRNATPGGPHDIWVFQPWRSPGLAPVSDSCGMAGGSPVPVFNGGEYTTTIYAKQGDLGSKQLKPRPTGMTWKAGDVANVSWYLAFNHGGGYKFRICPKSETLNEECFQKPEHQLEFASTEHIVLLKEGPQAISNTIVQHGGGVGWMLNPIPMPNFVGSDCDDMNGHPCHGCPCGSGYPGGNTNTSFPNPFGRDRAGQNTAIVDLIRVPQVPAGDYVVGFRWDCETSSQVWTQCSDITIE
eukprot:m.94655 g.94655  ORF g.94655 m.94655 type:complete len:351 (-) comp20381_c0_seq1:152-1204(-)